MKQALARMAYSSLLRLLTPAYLLRLWWRGAKEPAYRLQLPQRLGFYRRRAAPVDLWIHAVSLGETLAAAPLIDALRAARPQLRLLLTHSTATGQAAGAKLLKSQDQQTWLPYDTPGAVRRFLQHYRPRVGVLMETEVWPNLLKASFDAAVPVVLANARLSERSLAKGLRLDALLRPAVESLSRVMAQSSEDLQRLVQAGARHATVVGNLKFDISPHPKRVALGHQWRQQLPRPVVLAAVTREGEEAALLPLWQAVPRHPQRFDEVAMLARHQGFTVARRSRWSDSPPEDALRADVWLGDSLGEMATYYGLADVALLGGSFAPLGGQNLIEAAACGCPLVMGPHTFNFALAAELAQQAGAALSVTDLTTGVHAAVALAKDPDRNLWVDNAMAFAAAHRGAGQRMAHELLAMLPG
jgi:3-deoxy-D-manno-octulosonic-acid transferase